MFQAPRDRYLVKNASQNLQGNAVDPLDGCVTELEAKVKAISDEIADNANKIDRFMERVTVTDYHSDP